MSKVNLVALESCDLPSFEDPEAMEKYLDRFELMLDRTLLLAMREEGNDEKVIDHLLSCLEDVEEQYPDKFCFISRIHRDGKVDITAFLPGVSANSFKN